MKLKYDKNKIAAIERKLTDLYKKEILKKDLYDTGALYRSIDVKLKISGTNITFEVASEDYLKYLDDPYSVTEDFMNSSKYKEILDDIEELVADAIYNGLTS